MCLNGRFQRARRLKEQLCHRHAGFEARILRQEGKARTFALFEKALVGLSEARGDLEEGRLARTIDADQADALAGFDRQVELIENRSGAEREADVMGAKEAHGRSGARSFGQMRVKGAAPILGGLAPLKDGAARADASRPKGEARRLGQRGQAHSRGVPNGAAFAEPLSGRRQMSRFRTSPVLAWNRGVSVWNRALRGAAGHDRVGRGHPRRAGGWHGSCFAWALSSERRASGRAD